jgi:hypothetical protein
MKDWKSCYNKSKKEVIQIYQQMLSLKIRIIKIRIMLNLKNRKKNNNKNQNKNMMTKISNSYKLISTLWIKE